MPRWVAATHCKNMFFRLVALFQEDPVGVVVLVCCPFGVDGLLDDLLRGLRMHRREREREHPDPEKVRLFFAHFSTAFVDQKLRPFDAGDLPNGSAEKPDVSTQSDFGLHPRKYGGSHGRKKKIHNCCGVCRWAAASQQSSRSISAESGRISRILFDVLAGGLLEGLRSVRCRPEATALDPSYMGCGLGGVPQVADSNRTPSQCRICPWIGSSEVVVGIPKYGRHEETRTPDLYRVKVAL